MSRVYPIKIHRHTVLIDSEDVDCIEDIKWRVDKNSGAVVRTERIDGVKKTVLLHRKIMGKYCNLKGKVIDHINHDRLDNRKNNLRVCTDSENKLNRLKQKNNKSGYIGVHKRSDCINSWVASASHNGQYCYLGSYDEADVAAGVRDSFIHHVREEFGYFNYKEFINK